MLKLIYTETGLQLERLTGSLEEVVSKRVILALRLAQPIYVEPSHASFLLPKTVPELPFLEMVTQLERQEAIAIVPVDTQYVEVSMDGTWIAETVDAHTGMFLATLSDRAEVLIHTLWQEMQTYSPSFVPW